MITQDNSDSARSGGAPIEPALHRFFEQSRDLVCVVDSRGLARYTNQAALEALGYREADILGKPFSYFVHPEDMNKVAPEFSSLYGGEPAASRLEVRCRCADGSYRWVAWSATILPDDNLLYAIGHDIAGLKELEKALVGSKEQLQLIIDTVPAFVFYKDT
ncbi:MAG: PAS domain S-box protein, partial [Actinobacteria bacterium]|nr:PAS domain S-box protein [Actinomycetota bacterium]